MKTFLFSLKFPKIWVGYVFFKWYFEKKWVGRAMGNETIYWDGLTGERLEKQPEIPWDIGAHSTWPQEKILNSYLHALMTSTERVHSSTWNG